MEYPPLSKPRWGCAAAVAGRRLYVAGGCVGEPANVLRSVECYDNSLKRWVLVKPMQWPRWGHTLVACEGKLYAVGGSYTRPRSAAAEEYDPAANEWRRVEGPESGCRWGAACASDGQGHLVLVGGLDAQGQLLDTVEIFAPGGRRRGWEAGPRLSSARAGHAVALVDGYLYCTGGRGDDGYAVQDVERIECQDTPPASWEWQRLPNMTEPRVSHAAVRCGSQLMVLGGLNEDGYLQGTEIFNDATGEWQYVGDLNRPRSGCAAVAYDVVEEGDVWVVGGGDGEATNEGEVYRRQKWRICRAESRPVGEGGAFRLEDDAMLGAEPELDDGTKHVPRRAGSKADSGPGLGRKSFRPRQSKAALNREGQAYTMSDVKQDHDSLELHKRQEMQVLYASHGDSKVVFSANVSKMNRKGKVQARVLCITDLHVFNLDKKCKPMWSQPLSSLALAVETPLLHGVLLCFDNESGGGRVSRHDLAAYSYHLGCILLKMPAVSLLTGQGQAQEEALRPPSLRLRERGRAGGAARRGGAGRAEGPALPRLPQRAGGRRPGAAQPGARLLAAAALDGPAPRPGARPGGAADRRRRHGRHRGAIRPRRPARPGLRAAARARRRHLPGADLGGPPGRRGAEAARAPARAAGCGWARGAGRAAGGGLLLAAGPARHPQLCEPMKRLLTYVM